VFPFYDNKDELTFIKYRKTNFDPKKDKNKEWCFTDTKPILFGMDQCNLENKTLIMTEGQIDSLSVVEVGFENAVSVPTGKNGYTWVPYCWDWLQRNTSKQTPVSHQSNLYSQDYHHHKRKDSLRNFCRKH
jgi:hypothetical protein